MISENGQAKQLYTQFRFWEQVKLLYHAERKIEFKVNPPNHTIQGDCILQISISLDSYRPKDYKHIFSAHCIYNSVGLH